MCGRFTLRARANQIAEAFGTSDVPEFSSRYNIAPTQQVPTISLKDGKRHFSFRRWGLIPSWAKDEKIGNSLINARAETVAEKPAFRSAFKRSRCLIVTDGFYEWQKTDQKLKQPYFIHMKNDQPFAFAGLAERWKNGDEVLESCTVITTDPNPLMARLHDRMPVILPPEEYDLWLDPEFQGKEKLLSLLRPYSDEEMEAYPVSTTVNSPKNETASCLERI